MGDGSYCSDQESPTSRPKHEVCAAARTASAALLVRSTVTRLSPVMISMLIMVYSRGPATRGQSELLALSFCGDFSTPNCLTANTLFVNGRSLEIWLRALLPFT